MLTALWNILFFFVVIFILITFHEFGHFYVARRCGVKVLRFSLGFGPVIWSHTGKDGTEYVLSLLPFGGYVKMKGETDDEEDEDDVANAANATNAAEIASAGGAADAANVTGATAGEPHASDVKDAQNTQDKAGVIETDFAEFRTGSYQEAAADATPERGAGAVNAAGVAKSEDGISAASSASSMDADSFSAQSVGKRALIIAAGPVANFLLTIVLFFICHLAGVRTLLPVVGYVYPESALAQTNVQSYDLIRKVDGDEVENWQEVVSKFMLNLGDSVSMDVQADLGKGQSRQVQVDLKGIDLDPERDLLQQIGIEPCVGRMRNVVGNVFDGSPAQQAGLQVNDKILAINEIPTPDWFSINHAKNQINDPNNIAAFKDGSMQLQDLNLLVERNGQQLTLVMTPKLAQMEGEKKPRIMMGIAASVEPIPEIQRDIQYGPIEAFGKSLALTADMSMVLLNALKDMLVGVISVKNISGPISMAEVAGASASWGFIPFLWILGTISVNLGIFNLIPIPVLDGGQLVFCAYEKIVGHKPSARVQTYLTILGVSLLISLTLLAVINDVLRLF